MYISYKRMFIREEKIAKKTEKSINYFTVYHVTCDECLCSYKIVKRNYTNSIKKFGKDLCRSCSVTGSRGPFYGKTHTEIVRKKSSERMSLLVGEKNSFYGKKHSDKTKAHLSKISKEKIASGEVDWRNPGFLAEQKKPGKTEHLKKYLDSLTLEERKVVYGSPGKANPMYGKPSPEGSGNGWKGWYKGYFFRSLLELSFMVRTEVWEIAESKKYSVDYVDSNGNDRTYRPDFHSKGRVIEIKPKKLVNTELNKLKFAAAFKKYPNFTILTEDDLLMVSVDELFLLIQQDVVEFMDKYKPRWEVYYNKTKAEGL